MRTSQITTCIADGCGRRIPRRPYHDPTTVRACCVACAVALQHQEHPEPWMRLKVAS